MKKTNAAGAISIISGGLVYGYTALGNFMTGSSDLSREHFVGKAQPSLIDIFKPSNFDWIDSISWGYGQKIADYIVHMPLFLLLIIIGAILLLIGGLFVKD